MKKFTLLAILIMAAIMPSCKKCVTCTTTVTTDAPGTINDNTAQASSEVCGTSSEIDAAEGTTTSTASQGGVTVTITEKTTCQ